MRKLWLLLLILVSGWLIGCTNQPAESDPLADLPVPTAPIIPPTYTPLPPGSQLNAVPVVTVTQAPLPTEETSTPVPFGANVLELHLTIPSIGLDRRMQGGVNSQIILVDESNGFSVQRDNQAGVLLDLQQVLPDLVLDAVPDGCVSCVRLSFNLPFAGTQGDGWLQDPVLLASLENYFTTNLGPHFPPETIVGLRRSASPYAPAHWVAVLADGRMYRWMVNESETAPVSVASPDLLAALATIDPQSLAQEYLAPCPGAALESLFVSERLIALVCPEYAITTALQPLYVALDAALAELLASSEATLARPPAILPLDAVLHYQRVDQAQLTIFSDGTAVAFSRTIEPITTTLSSSQVISLTTDLLASGSLRTGLTTFLPPESASGVTPTATPNSPRSAVLVRGADGVYDAQWYNTSEVPALAALNTLLTEILFTNTAVPEATAEGTPEANPPITPEAEPVVTPSDG